MARRRSFRRRMSEDEARRFDFELHVGPLLHVGVSDAELDALLRAAWEHRRGELLADWRRPGERPWAWWAFDPELPQPSPGADEVLALLDLGELPDAEVESVFSEAIQTLVKRPPPYIDPPSCVAAALALDERLERALFTVTEAPYHHVNVAVNLPETET